MDPNAELPGTPPGLKPQNKRRLLLGGAALAGVAVGGGLALWKYRLAEPQDCLLYTSDAADDM
jgi:hypothetical protein